MDNMYRHAAAEAPPPRGYGAGYLEAPYAAAHDPAQPDHTAPPWGYDGHPYGFRCDFPAPSPGAAGFGAFGFDPSVPPPPFCPPGPFPPAPISSFSRGAPAFEPFTPQFRPGPHTARYDLDPSQTQLRDYEDFSERGAVLRVPGPAPRPEDQAALQRRQDLQWLGRFLQGRDKPPQTLKTPQPPRSSAAPDPRAALYRAAALVSRLAETCEALSSSVEDEAVWADSYVAALRVKTELQEQLQSLGDGDRLARWKAKLARVARRRARRLRAREALREEEALREDRLAEKDAAINAWRLQQVQRVEEKKKEQELKLAADTVLCEVRKKQADVKRMQDILRSLEKLRRLRKEAAARKGIDTEQECDEAFSSRLERLRSVMKKRTAVYSAEEKALMVMLEGEQEEERRREQEKRTKKERERHLQRKRRVSAMLFGEDLPAGSVLQPFREYHTQAERSLHALLQIRSGWDTFVVPADRPDGSPVPHGWILPDAPSDPAWASALLSADAE